MSQVNVFFSPCTLNTKALVKWLLRQGVTSIYKINKGGNRTQVARLSNSDAPSSDAEGNRCASTVALKNHNGNGGPHRETGTRSK